MALPNENKPQNEPFDPWEEAEKKTQGEKVPIRSAGSGQASDLPKREESTPPRQEIPQAGEIPLETPKVSKEPLPKEPPREEDLLESYFPPPKKKSVPGEPQAETPPKRDFQFAAKPSAQGGSAPGGKMEEDYFGVAGKEEKRPEVPWGRTLPKQRPGEKAPALTSLDKEPLEGKPLKAKTKKRKLLKEILKFVGIFTIVFAVIFVILNWPSIAVNLKYWWEQNRGGEDSTAEDSIDLSIEDPGGIPSDDRIRISKIKVNAPIIFSKDPGDKALLEDLKKGVVHYPGTAMPGETGNCFITGHSSNYWWIKSDYNTVFTLLPKLVVGDKIVIYYKQQKFIYEVKEISEVGPGQTEVLNPTEEPTLTLMTCVPIGTNLRRLITKADQISPAPGENTDLNRPRLPAE